MTRALTLDDFSAAEIAASSKRAALRFLAGMTHEKDRPDARDDAVRNWRFAVRFARRWASVEEIAEAAGIPPDTVSKICEAREAASRR
ncbi:MAG: hypothetical protein F4108_06225 [Acidimicrobiaceae bacterium]|nr:hypothetical protein [Acidimicrobiaceae bacterium]